MKIFNFQNLSGAMISILDKFSISRSDFKAYMSGQFKIAAAMDDDSSTLSATEYNLYFEPMVGASSLKTWLGGSPVTERDFLNAVDKTLDEKIKPGENLFTRDILDFFSLDDMAAFEKIFRALLEADNARLELLDPQP